jgi:hypothetical protein
MPTIIAAPPDLHRISFDLDRDVGKQACWWERVVALQLADPYDEGHPVEEQALIAFGHWRPFTLLGQYAYYESISPGATVRSDQPVPQFSGMHYAYRYILTTDPTKWIAQHNQDALRREQEQRKKTPLKSVS